MRTIIHLSCGNMLAKVRSYLEGYYPEEEDELKFINWEPVHANGKEQEVPSFGVQLRTKGKHFVLKGDTPFDMADFFLDEEFPCDLVLVIPGMEGVFDLIAYTALIAKFEREFVCGNRSSVDVWIIPPHRPGQAAFTQPHQLIHMVGESEENGAHTEYLTID